MLFVQNVEYKARKSWVTLFDTYLNKYAASAQWVTIQQFHFNQIMTLKNGSNKAKK